MKGLLGTAAALIFLSLQAGAAASDPIPATERRTLIHDGIERTYIVHTPSTAGGTPHPIVLVLHGGGGNGESAARMTGFSATALRDGAIVVYPEGTGRLPNILKTWNAGHCCGYAMENRIDDIGFIGALIDRLIRDDGADPRRVYVTGLSNGGMMAHRVAIALSHKIAAVAPVIAGLFGDEAKPTSPVPAIIVNGRLDRSVPLDGGDPGGRFPDAWDGTPLNPAGDQGTFWAKANGCDAAPIPSSESSGTVTVRRYRCPTGQEVVRYIVQDSGHAWPGGTKGSRWGDAPSPSFDATGAIWAFFKNHAR